MKSPDEAQAIRQARTVHDLHDALFNVTRGAGASYFSFILIPRRPLTGFPFLVTDYPKDFVDLYLSSDFLSADPVVARARRVVAPFDWLDAPVNVVAETLVMRQAAGLGITGGVTAPVRDHAGRLGVLTIVSNDPGIRREILPILPYHAQLAHEAVLRMIPDVAGNEAVYGITPLNQGERECLRWGAAGKSAADIAALLEIPERRVNYHLDNARTKLSATNRVHAAVKAALSGMIEPPDDTP